MSEQSDLISKIIDEPGENRPVIPVIERIEMRMFVPQVVSLAAQTEMVFRVERSPEIWHISVIGTGPSRLSFGEILDPTNAFELGNGGVIKLPGRDRVVCVRNNHVSAAVRVTVVAISGLPFDYWPLA